MATMLEDESSFDPDPMYTPSTLLQTEDAFELNYAAAGAFTTYLRERYGIALLLDYYEASSDTDAATSRAIFEDVLGDSFAEVEADYLDGGMPATNTSLGCDGPDVAWSGDTWEHTFQLACEEPNVMGPEQSQIEGGPETFLWSTVTMTAPEGWISLDLMAADPTWISLRSCERLETVYVDAEQPHAEVHLGGGRYVVFADAFVVDAPTARVTVRHLDAAPSALHPSQLPGRLSHATRTRSGPTLLCTPAEPTAMRAPCSGCIAATKSAGLTRGLTVSLIVGLTRLGVLAVSLFVRRPLMTEPIAH